MKIECYFWELMPKNEGYLVVGFAEEEKKNFIKSDKLLFYDGQIAKDHQSTFILKNPEPRWLDYLLERQTYFDRIKI